MWNDAIDCRPRFVFDVQLKDGSVQEALYIMGNFETTDGQVLYPERFAFKECRVVVPLSGLPSGLTPRALDGAICACKQPRFSVCNPNKCIICGKPRHQ